MPGEEKMAHSEGHARGARRAEPVPQSQRVRASVPRPVESAANNRRVYCRSALLLAALLCLAGPAFAQPKAAPKYLVFFTEWSAQLNEPDHAIIASVAAAATKPGAAHVIITGYADRLGSSAADMELSILRAQIVRDAMELDGVPAAQMQMVAAGAQPGPAGVINRRVEIAIGSDR